MEKSKKIYMDYASATPIDSRVISKMIVAMKEYYANPGSMHEVAVATKSVLNTARKDVAEILGSRSEEVIFTGGATESNNLAILGVFEKCRESIAVPHIIVTNIEHSSVLEIFKYLEKKEKIEVAYVPVEKNGIVDAKKIQKEIKSNTILVSVMYANNEIGTIQPIQEIAKGIRYFKKTNCSNFPLFHVDANQAINYLPIKVEKLGLDLMSFSSAKIYGPKGVGVLYVKKNTPIKKILFGGDQEFNLRPGTENIVLIAGLVESLKIAEKIKAKERERLIVLRDYFFKRLSKITDFEINGDKDTRLPNNINITIDKIPSDLLMIELSAKGIYVSEKSACKSGDKKGSHVISAICSRENKSNSLRISFGRQTKKSDVDYLLKSLDGILIKLKKWYPVVDFGNN